MPEIGNPSNVNPNRDLQIDNEDWRWPMCVITVSRGLFSGGRILAQTVAERLGYRCVGGDVIVERAAALGARHDELRKALGKPPAFWERAHAKRCLMLALLKAALAEEVRDGDVVYHGVAGHQLLRGAPRVLRVRLIAPLETRIRAAQDRCAFSRSEAIAHLKRIDRERQRWTLSVYGFKWTDPSLYDLVINLETLPLEQACRLVVRAAEQDCYRSTLETQREMDDLALASRVYADLAIHGPTSALDLDVVAFQGIVSITGKGPAARDTGHIGSIARAVSGVLQVRLQLTPAARGTAADAASRGWAFSARTGEATDSFVPQPEPEWRRNGA
jgi:cytidylate kinase